MSRVIISHPLPEHNCIEGLTIGTNPCTVFINMKTPVPTVLTVLRSNRETGKMLDRNVKKMLHSQVTLAELEYFEVQDCKGKPATKEDVEVFMMYLLHAGWKVEYHSNGKENAIKIWADPGLKNT